jgi:hypothetical protein
MTTAPRLQGWFVIYCVYGRNVWRNFNLQLHMKQSSSKITSIAKNYAQKAHKIFSNVNLTLLRLLCLLITAGTDWNPLFLCFVFLKHTQWQCNIRLWQQHCNVKIPKNLTPCRDSNPGRKSNHWFSAILSTKSGRGPWRHTYKLRLWFSWTCRTWKTTFAPSTSTRWCPDETGHGPVFTWRIRAGVHFFKLHFIYICMYWYILSGLTYCGKSNII